MILDDPSREWSFWDYRLVKALIIRKDMISGTGVPIYWDQSERVRFEVNSFVSKSKRALDAAEESARKGKAKNHGKIFYPVPIAVDGGMLPTLEEFLEEQALKRQMIAGNIHLGGEFSNAGWVEES